MYLFKFSGFVSLIRLIILVTLLTELNQTFAQAPTIQWLHNIGNENEDRIIDMKFDKFNNLFRLGEFLGIADFDSSLDSNIINAGTNTAAFLMKTSSEDQLNWVVVLGNNRNVHVFDLEVDIENNIYIVGEFIDSLNANPLYSPYMLYEDPSFQGFNTPTNGFILKYNQQGELIWAKHIPESKEVTAITSLSNGNICFSGFFGNTLNSTTDLDPGIAYVAGYGDIGFIVCLNSDGNFVWGHSYGQECNVSYLNFTRMNTNSKNDILIGGKYYGTFNVDPENSDLTITNLPTLNNYTYTASYVMKLDSSGNFKDIMNFPNGKSYVMSIAIDSLDNIYVTGNFSFEIDLDPGVNIDLHNNADTGYSDFYVVKIDSLGQAVWAHTIGTGSNDLAYNIVLKNNNEILLSGFAIGAPDFDTGSNQLTLQGFDGFLASYNSNNFSLNWVTSTDFNMSAAVSFPLALCLDTSNIIYTGGQMQTMALFSCVLTKWQFTNTILPKMNVNNVSFYPNPTSDQIIMNGFNDGSIIKIEVIDQTGSIMFSYFERASKNLSINTKELNSGYYLLRIINDKNLISYPFIKIH